MNRCLLPKLSVVILLLLLTALICSAQFYSGGSDPSSVRWKQMETEHFRIVYPRQLDSLSRVYAGLLEQYYNPVGATIGHTPNQNYRRRMPVILHAYTANANGSVVWAPRRIELYTTPDASSPLPTPWEQHLTIHESRHSAQMQFVYDPQYKPFGWLTGELFGGAISAVYGGPALFEGDAVTAETELTNSGRGRSDAFLEYYKVSLDQGQYRDWYKWRYGSQRFYTPDYYRLGYLTVAGIRATYDDPLFMNRYYERVRKHFLPFNNINKTLKTSSGKNLRNSFREVEDTLITYWRREADKRAPFIKDSTITRPERHFVEFRGTVFAGDDCYSIRSGMARTSEIVRIDSSGKVTAILNVGGSASDLRYCNTLRTLIWSEKVSDPRWEMRSTSIIRTLGPDGKVRNLTSGTRYYNPSASSVHPLVSATEYPVQGGSKLIVLNAKNGKLLREWAAPQGMQLVSSTWLGDDIYVSAVTGKGFGIYRLRDTLTSVLPPFNASVDNLMTKEDRICFSSDISGVTELYSLNPDSGIVTQLTSSKWGASSYAFDKSCKTLICSSLATDGRMIHSIDAGDLINRETDFGSYHGELFAEKITSQYNALNVSAADSLTIICDRNYSKLGHLMRFHSWIPAYVDIDRLKSMSFDNLSSSLNWGATAFFQNDLSTMSGYIGWRGPDAGKINFTYSGWYPVIEASASINDRKAYDYKVENDTLKVFSSGRAQILGSVKLYVPFRFNSGGWNRGIVPQVAGNISNDRLHTDGSICMNRVTASIRAYTMQGIPSSCIYPRLGIGIEGGYSFRAGLTDTFSPERFLYLYGYLPGFARTHGIRLTLSFQQELQAKYGETYISMAPRGFANVSGIGSIIAGYPNQGKFTVDYALPFAAVDWSFLGPIAYIRNFELKAHYDLGWYTSIRRNMTLSSVGADLNVRLGNLIWVPYDTRIGVSYCYNSGIALDNPHYVGLVFSIDL